VFSVPDTLFDYSSPSYENRKTMNFLCDILVTYRKRISKKTSIFGRLINDKRGLDLVLYTLKADYKTALDYYEKLIKFEANNPKGYFGPAKNYFELKEYKIHLYKIFRTNYGSDVSTAKSNK
jgi:hypothetical protein